MTPGKVCFLREFTGAGTSLRLRCTHNPAAIILPFFGLQNVLRPSIKDVRQLRSKVLDSSHKRCENDPLHSNRRASCRWVQVVPEFPEPAAALEVDSLTVVSVNAYPWYFFAGTRSRRRFARRKRDNCRR